MLAAFKSDLHHLTLLYIQFNLRCLFSSTPLFYLLLSWAKEYIFLSQQRNKLCWFPRYFWREANHDCLQEYRRDSATSLSGSVVLINLRCISDLLNWEIQKGQEKDPQFIHAVVSFTEQLRNKPSIVQCWWLEVTVNAGRLCYEWCVHWTCVIIGKKKNSIIGRENVVITCYLQRSVNMGKKTPTFGPCGVLCLVI